MSHTQYHYSLLLVEEGMWYTAAGW